MSLVRGKWGRTKSRSSEASRIAPGELLEFDPITPSSSSCNPEPISPFIEIPLGSTSAQDVAKGPRIAWWRHLRAFSGTQNKRKPQLESRHTAWAKLVCPVMAKSRQTVGSRKSQVQLAKVAAGCSKSQMESPNETQGKMQAQHARPRVLSDPDVSLFDINKVILRGSDLDKERQRRQEVQQQSRLRAEKVRKMQASQCALRQKHDAWIRDRANHNGEGLPSKDSNDLVAVSIESVGYLYSLKEPVSPDFSAVPKESGRASSMSAATEATTVAELQDLDDESNLVSLPSTSPEPRVEDS